MLVIAGVLWAVFLAIGVVVLIRVIRNKNKPK